MDAIKVCERDIDLVLLEELTVSTDFARWFVEKAWPESPALRAVERCWHSVSNALGESDLELVFDSVDSPRQALLIENKVNAPPQPEQAARYRKRGELGVEEQRWSAFRTCMVAPQRYLAGTKDARGYGGTVTYEAIAAWFEARSEDSVRARFKAKLLTRAIAQELEGWTVIPNAAVTDFWKHYWELARTQHPALEMREPGPKPAGSTWPDFRPSGLSKGWSIVHKTDSGFMDLQLPGRASALPEVERLCRPFLPPGVEVVRASKSAALRLKVPEVYVHRDFGPQAEAVAEALEAADTLRLLGPALTNVLRE